MNNIVLGIISKHLHRDFVETIQIIPNTKFDVYLIIKDLVL